MAAPYDTVETALNMARVLMNDAMQSLAGEILKDSAPFAQTLTNTAWRKLQEFLADKRYSKMDTEVVFLNVPATVDTDPLSQVYIDWTGYHSGVGYVNPPVLPENFITPWEIWERPYGSNRQMTEMDLIENGLPSVPKKAWNGLYDWRGDAIYMPGALVATDIRLRYGGYLSDFATDVAPWYQQPIPIMRAATALAYYICWAAGSARGDAAAAAMESAGQESAMQIVNRDLQDRGQPIKPSESGKGKMTDRFSGGA